MAYRKRSPVGPHPSKAQAEFGRLIEERGVTQVSVAEQLGVSSPAVSEWRSAWSVPLTGNRYRIAEWSRGRDPLGNPVGDPRIPVEDWDLPPVAAEEAA